MTEPTHPERRIEEPTSNFDSWIRSAEQYAKRKLLWSSAYRTISYVRSSLWIVPLVSIVLVLPMAPLLRALDHWLVWRIAGLDVAGATALFQTVITLTLSLIVFTFGSLLVAIQVASGQLTPRIIATALLRDNVVRYSVGLFVFTLVFAVSALNRLENNVPDIVALLTALLGIASVATGLFLIDYAARLLRPVSIIARIATEAIGVVDAVYPARADESGDVRSKTHPPLGTPVRTVAHHGTSEILLAVDIVTLVTQAGRARGVVELVPQVGDFVARGEPLFALYEGAASIDDRTLRAAVAFGPERTMEQDPMFGFRILVDIALKALSAAINDPTTAVLAIDQLHRLLRVVGQRRLHGEEVPDAEGWLRVIYRTPNWTDFVNVSFTEIRACGAGNVQIARRLRAMLDNLVASLPEHRRPPLVAQRRLLDRAIEKLYPIPEDLALARIPDSQGLGGASRATAEMSQGAAMPPDSSTLSARLGDGGASSQRILAAPQGQPTPETGGTV